MLDDFGADHETGCRGGPEPLLRVVEAGVGAACLLGRRSEDWRCGDGRCEETQAPQPQREVKAGS